MPILLMADYGADPLWRRGQGGKANGMIALDALPLSTRLTQDLRAWAARFDALSETDYEWPNTADERKWVADGQALLEPDQRELGAGYDVSYFDYFGDHT